jgi:hypothetical protein
VQLTITESDIDSKWLYDKTLNANWVFDVKLKFDCMKVKYNCLNFNFHFTFRLINNLYCWLNYNCKQHSMTNNLHTSWFMCEGIWFCWLLIVLLSTTIQLNSRFKSSEFVWQCHDNSFEIPIIIASIQEFNNFLLSSCHLLYGKRKNPSRRRFDVINSLIFT